MARSVSLSDDAFRALREEKQPGESDSDVILRLRREARAKRKDPMKFLKSKVPLDWTLDEFEQVRARMDEADRRRWEELERLRKEE